MKHVLDVDATTKFQTFSSPPQIHLSSRLVATYLNPLTASPTATNAEAFSATLASVFISATVAVEVHGSNPRFLIVFLVIPRVVALKLWDIQTGGINLIANLPPGIGNTIGLEKVAFVLQAYSKPLEPGTKCGSKDIQTQNLLQHRHSSFFYQTQYYK
ncbi:hypothetical protein CK203_065920 [Vitis vinifera]|uniref:Uncharacterized protein n=1 Tax=Vitis vinifera TaxID=29760 RepID=A0A438GSL6_VITVI|nr:hypothetical protein CK203_065920 [Vitis vinifera]